MQQLLRNATAALVAAAVAAHQVAAVAEGFTMVSLSLGFGCVAAACSKSEGATCLWFYPVYSGCWVALDKYRAPPAVIQYVDGRACHQ